MYEGKSKEIYFKFSISFFEQLIPYIIKTFGNLSQTYNKIMLNYIEHL